jgi:hypothetical protein
MKNTILKVVLIALCFCNVNTFAQGCSDAGFCSIGNAFKDHDEAKKNSLDLGLVYGIAEEDVTVYSQYVTYTRSVNENFGISLKLTASTANGNFGTISNLGDAFVTGNYKFKSSSEDKKWAVLFGFKAPFNTANKKINGFPIPMDYQSSLGTFDLIAGTNYTVKKWDFNVAFQIPIINANKNSFQGNSVFKTTNLFERKADVLFRTTYTLKSNSEKFTFKPNALFIFHTAEDSFENNFGKRENIKGSSGLTINANVIINYKINGNSSIETSLASPLLVREERPDGLTRKFTLGLNYKLDF